VTSNVDAAAGGQLAHLRYSSSQGGYAPVDTINMDSGTASTASDAVDSVDGTQTEGGASLVTAESAAAAERDAYWDAKDAYQTLRIDQGDLGPLKHWQTGPYICGFLSTRS
jgi:hypothetical protein